MLLNEEPKSPSPEPESRAEAEAEAEPSQTVAAAAAPPAAAVSEQAAKDAEDMKAAGNERFQKGKYEQAVDMYSKAIELNPNVATYYANRAFAYIKTEAYGYALADADKGIELDPAYPKSYYRRGSANMALGKYKESLKDFRTVCRLQPNDADARKKMDECEKIVRREAFEKAISVDHDKKSITTTIHLDAIPVEDSYDGPRFEEEITKEFCLEL